jgi:hypothetical protein
MSTKLQTQTRFPRFSMMKAGEPLLRFATQHAFSRKERSDGQVEPSDNFGHSEVAASRRWFSDTQ